MIYATWRTKLSNDEELYLPQYDLFRSERFPNKDGISLHGGALIALKKRYMGKKILYQQSICLPVQHVYLRLIHQLFYSKTVTSLLLRANTYLVRQLLQNFLLFLPLPNMTI